MTEQSKEVTILEDGRKQLVLRKSVLKGKVKPNDVMDAVLMAARGQAEYLVEKLSRGSPLDASEVKMLKELSEIVKSLPAIQEPTLQINQQINTLTDSSGDIKKLALESLLSRLQK